MIMKIRYDSMFLGIVLLFPCTALAQDTSEREIYPNKNVRLVLLAVPPDLPKELKDRYESFLPLFEEVLKENTTDREPESALFFRLVPAVKLVGSAKTKRAIVIVTAYKRNSRSEYVANLLLHSYATGKNVNKDEIAQFLKQQILSPLGGS
jgi:hypothetical protein